MHTSVERRSDPRFTAREHGPPQGNLSHKAEIPGPVEPRVGDGWRLIDVFLTGGAPWGFSLKGGLEYHEPLTITKVEEGSQAWAVGLQVGDVVVAVNDLPLGGYRQEAIGLVKSSHKTLALGVRRRTEAVSRPHSWHAIRFAQSEASQRGPKDALASQCRYDASLSSEDLTRSWDQTNLQRVSNQFSSVGSMDSLEHCPPPYPTGCLSQAKPSGSTEYLSGTKRDSAYSSYSTSSGTPDHTLSRSNTASTENVACKAGAWDSRNWQSLEEKQGAGCGGGRDSPRNTGSTAGGRSHFGPIWHVPEKRQIAAPSPSPPLRVRSESLLVAQIYEKGSFIAYNEEPHPYAEQSRGTDRALDGAWKGHQVNNRGPGLRGSSHPTSKNGKAFPSQSSGYGGQLSSRSSMEFPAGHAPYQQLQYSDESTYHQRRRGTFPAVSGLPDAGSAQEMLVDSVQQPTDYDHAWTSTATAVSTLDPDPSADRHSQYYCVTARHRPSARDEARKGDWGGVEGVELAQTVKETERNSKIHKGKNRHSHPLPQRRYPDNQDSHCHGRPEGLPLDRLPAKPNGSARHSQGRNNGYHEESHYVNYPLEEYEEDKGQALQPRDPPQDVWLSREDIHSQETVGPEVGSHPEARPPGPQTGKQVTGNDRFATILRNEIQNRKVRLQKSQSTATLLGSGQTGGEEEGAAVSAETSATSSDGSFSGTYKDHLKEVQARVLQATSFRRRDLELEALAPAPTAIIQPEASPPAVVSRIGGRKRFPSGKKVRSVSEPDKMNEVGLEPELEPEPSHPEPLVSLADRRKVFEQTGKPVFRKPLPKQARQGSPEEARGGRTKGRVGDGITTGRGHPEGQQQRLGTFAEYEATWNVQRKPFEARPPAKYHSADNILDSGVEEWSRTSSSHERSRSSPSADLCGQNIPDSGRESDGFSYPEHRPAGHNNATPRASDQKHQVSAERRSPARLDHFPEPPPDGAPRDDPESQPRAAPSDRTYPRPPRDRPLPRNPGSKSRGSVSLEEAGALQPRPENRRRSEGVLSHSPRRDVGRKDKRRASHGVDSYQRELPLPPPPPPPPPPYGSTCSSDPAGQLRPPMDGPHPPCPCPHPVPQRPADQPPASTLHDAPSRMQSLSENRSWRAPKKLPVGITHEAEGSRPSVGPAREPPPPANVPLEPRWAEGQAHAHQGTGLEATPPQPASTNGVSPEEERKREELARDIVERDKSLADILDQSGMRTTMDLMEGIFPQGGALLEGHHKRGPRPHPQGPRSSKGRCEEDSMPAAVGVVASSSYYDVSAPMAEMLMKMKDMPGSDSEEELDMDLAHKKHQLIDSLSKKLQVLKEVREGLLEDVQSNDTLGEEVECSVEQVCKPNELDKFRMFVGDLDKVVNLLLSLSGRLARVENALHTLQEGSAPEEKRTLMEKRKVLIRQHEDAKELKENLDRRERIVSDILAGQLSEERLADFRHFVKMKAELIIERRKLDDKIKLGEEQLRCLTDSLPPDQRPPF